MTWVRPLQSHRRAVRRQGAGGRGGAGRRDGADPVRRHHARPSLPQQGRDQGRGLRRLRGQAQRPRTWCWIRPSASEIVLPTREKLCAEAQVALRPDDGLLDEVAGLVEWPVPMLGTIDAQFMDVPPEVLIRLHARAPEDTSRSTTATARSPTASSSWPTTTRRDGGTTIVAGNERVLRARLCDAKFFWDQDRKVPLESALPALKASSSTPSSARRPSASSGIETLAGKIADHRAGADAAQASWRRASAKADLVTGMVGEFPELRASWAATMRCDERLPAAVADAIARSLRAGRARTIAARARRSSIAVALADKLDTLVGFWAIGEKPTGSRDPFALAPRRARHHPHRRREQGLRLPLGKQVLRRRCRPAWRFFADRLKVQMREKGVRHDVVDAVFALGGEDDLVRLLARVEALQSFLATEDGQEPAARPTVAPPTSFALRRRRTDARREDRRRARCGTDGTNGRESRCCRLGRRRASCEARVAARGFRRRDGGVGAHCAQPIDAFFDKVTVNVADEARFEI